MITKIVFSDKVYEIVKKIPIGSTLTYKEVAIRAGFPKAYRAVGNVLNKNYNKSIPCHRVVRSNGETGGYNRGGGMKAKILLAERVNLEKTNASKYSRKK